MESSTPWWTMVACWREWTQLPGPLLASGVAVRGFDGEAETDALVRSATSLNKDEVLMMGGTMASRDAHASVSEVDCDAGGFVISTVPPGSKYRSRDAYASSTLGMVGATELACLAERSPGGEGGD